MGSRLLPALLAHGHQVVVFVRSESKLKDLFGTVFISKCTIVTGTATDTNAIEKALIDNKCDGLVNSAGLAAIFPWQQPQLQEIEEAVATAAVNAGKELAHPMRCWFMGGLTVLDYPGMEGVKFFPLFAEHGLTHNCLSGKPQETLKWSMLAPSTMAAASKSIDLLETPRGNCLLATADTPPDWQHTILEKIPFIGPWAGIFRNAPRYGTTLEDCADFIASDLRTPDSVYVGHRVGIIEKSKGKTE
ncbi:MAG: hypothetical protein Q9167_003314 [Letrouitia subvulpina]